MGVNSRPLLEAAPTLEDPGAHAPYQDQLRVPGRHWPPPLCFLVP